MPRGFVVLLTFLLTLVSICHVRAEGDYTLAETRTYSIINRFEVVSISDTTLTDVKVTIFVGESGSTLYQQKVRYRMTPTPASMRTDVYGNTFAVLNLGTLKAREKRSLTVEKIVKNSGISFVEDIYQRKPSYDAFRANKANAIHLAPSKFVESDAPEIKAQAAYLDASKPVVQLAKDIYTGINVYLEYDLDPRYAHQGALNAQRTRRGVCTEFAGLYVAFCRALGIPARIVTGYWVSREMKLNVPVNVQGDRHAWPEFYLPDVGWIPAEPSMINIVNGKRVPNYQYFANIPPSSRHFVWALGMDVERNPNIEVSYKFQTRLGEMPPQNYDLDQDQDQEQGEDDQLLTADMVEETIKWIPDEAPAQ